MAKQEKSLVLAIVNQADLKLMKTNPKLLVLEFMAEWSEPCKVIRPTFEDLASEFKDSADFRTVDVDNKEFQAVARKANVELPPTFLLVKSGETVGRVVGANGAVLRSSIEKALNPASVSRPQYRRGG